MPDFKYRVGQRLAVTREGEDFLYEDAGTKVTVTEVGHRIGGSQWVNYRVVTDDGTVLYARSKDLRKLRKLSRVEGEKSMSVLGKVRELLKDGDTRLLEKYNVVDDCGHVTEDGKDLLWDMVFAEYKEEIVTKLKDLDSEEKSTKKK